MQIFYAGVAVVQHLPIEFEIEGPVAFNGADVLLAAFVNYCLEATVFYRPGVRRETACPSLRPNPLRILPSKSDCANSEATVRNSRQEYHIYCTGVP